MIRSNILTEGNIRNLVNVVDEQMDDVAGEERKRLETIESELADVRGRLGRLYDLVETTTAPALLDLAEYRLHSLHPQSVALPTPPGL